MTENEDDAERMLNEAYGRATDEEDDDDRYWKILRLRELERKQDEEIWKRNTERILRTLRVSIYIPLLLLAILDLLYFMNPMYLLVAVNIDYRGLPKIEIGLIAISAFFWVLRYLQYGITGISVPKILSKRFSWLQQQSPASKAIKEIEERIGTIKRASESSNAQVVSPRVRPTATMTEPRERLLKEVNRLGRSNAINLAFGLLSTVAGLSILYSTVFGSKVPETTTIEGFLIGYLPRLTLILFVELFAYFFLGLYKKGLSDIKYFQNEITNIESKAVALDSALNFADKDIVAGVIEKIANTERNHILEKGQTTVELEIAKSEKESLLSFVKIIPGFAKILDKEDRKNDASK
jgi:hypothetical protein